MSTPVARLISVSVAVGEGLSTDEAKLAQKAAELSDLKANSLQVVGVARTLQFGRANKRGDSGELHSNDRVHDEPSR